MAVNLSPVGGVAAQFFTNTGAVLTGGKLYTYAAGTTTPQVAYTTDQGNVPWTNPIVLNAAGRVPSSGEIWLTDDLFYKFVLRDSNDVLIATYDNIGNVSALTLPIDSSNITYDPPFTGSVLTNVETKLAETISLADFGAIGDGVTNNAAVFQALHNYLLQADSSRFVLIPEGHYSTTYPLTIVGYGVHVVGTGKVVISAPDGSSNESLSIGDWGNLSPTGGNVITGNLLKNASEIQIGSVAGYRVNDVVLVYSGTSVNATLPLNYIPLYKQWFTIREINTSTNTLKFTAQSDYNFLVSEGAKVTTSAATPAVSGSIQNIQFTNTSGFSGTYLHGIRGAFNFTVHNCRLDGFSSCGFTAASDQLTYDNVVFVGYNGLSAARFTGRVNYLNCTYRPRYTSPQNIGAFMEETPNTVYMDNCDIRSQVRFTNSSDATPPKRFIIKNSRIESLTGVSIFASGYNSQGYAVTIDNCEIIGPGGAPIDGTPILTMIDYAYSDSIQLTNNTFTPTSASVYAIYGSSLGGTELTRLIYGNRDDTTLGIHPSVPASVVLSNTTARERLTVEKTSGYNADLIAYNLYSGSQAYGYFGSRATDVNGMAAYFGVNAYNGSNYTSVIDRKVATYSGWAAAGYANNAANQASDRFSIIYETSAGTQKTYLNVSAAGIVTAGATANNQDLGSGSIEWRDIYLVNSPIVSSDRNRKQQIEVLSEVEKTVATELKGLIRKYKFNSSVELKGDNARFHIGFIAQDVEQAFVNHGLDPDQYGVVCTETWWQDEDGNIYQTSNIEGKVLTKYNRVAIRYEELIAFVISAL
jgi:hypothetical protein